MLSSVSQNLSDIPTSRLFDLTDHCSFSFAFRCARLRDQGYDLLDPLAPGCLCFSAGIVLD